MRTLGAEVECGRKAARKHSLTGLKQGRIMERNSKLTANARVLRKSMTKEESRLWYQFLCRYKPRFHRQYVIGPYIADFYCHQVKLVVELDGSQHCDPKKMEYDRERSKYLHSQGLKVLRFSNLDVMRRFESVCEAINLEVNGAIQEA